MEHAILQQKETFIQTLKQYKIPIENRTMLYYKLTSALKENPSDEVLLNLLITTICDYHVYLEFGKCRITTQSPNQISLIS